MLLDSTELRYHTFDFSNCGCTYIVYSAINKNVLIGSAEGMQDGQYRTYDGQLARCTRGLNRNPRESVDFCFHCNTLCTIF